MTLWLLGLPWWLGGNESACQWRRRGFNPWSRKIPWERKWQLTPVFLPGRSHGQRSLVGYSPWGCSLTQLSNWTTTTFKKKKRWFSLRYSIRELQNDSECLCPRPEKSCQKRKKKGKSSHFPTKHILTIMNYPVCLYKKILQILKMSSKFLLMTVYYSHYQFQIGKLWYIYIYIFFLFVCFKWMAYAVKIHL